MRRAAELLAAGGATVRDIARGVGYRQPAQFAKAFRRAFETSPSEYRAQAPAEADVRRAA
jgi:AraC-like DNA-binding protein